MYGDINSKYNYIITSFSIMNCILDINYTKIIINQHISVYQVAYLVSYLFSFQLKLIVH